MPTSITHIIPSGVLSNTYHGSYKDTISRIRFFESSNLPYCQILLEEDLPDSMLAKVADQVDPSFLIEYCSFPKTVKALRRRFPKALIAVRTHNIEPLQHLDNHGWWPQKGPVWLAYGMIRLFLADWVMKRFSSVIFSISDWENRVYWNWLPGRASVEWLPYFCPDHLLPGDVTNESKRRQIVCLPTSQKNRKSWDLVTRFITFAEHFREITGDKYDFLVTGNLADWQLPHSDVVTYTGMIEDLNLIMPKVKAIAILSGRGYGFKTTISDAIANGAVVLAHPRLFARCPEILKPAIIPLDVEKPGDFSLALVRMGERSNHSLADQQLRVQGHKILMELFRTESKVHAA